MELQFSNQSIKYLQSVIWEDKTEELTQEFRLPDGMPDIGHMAGAWGQLMVRSKEWQDRKVSISGGVSASAMYIPENGEKPESVEAWLPLRMQWDLPDGCTEGTFSVSCKVKSVDARNVSARRIMFRAVVCILGEGLVPKQLEICKPCDIPEDIQLLRKEYPVRLAKEAGEKTFILDEEVSLPVEADSASKLVRCLIQPEIIDKKIMGDKAVFRGSLLLDILCRCDDGNLVKQTYDLPISQYAELSGEYGPGAGLFVQMALTSAEPDLLEDGCVRMKIGMICQYVVHDSEMIEIVEDAYSPKREIEIRAQPLELPSVLEERQERVKAEKTIEHQSLLPMDMGLLLGNPEVYHDNEGVSVNMSGIFNYISADENDVIQGHSVSWTDAMEIPTGPEIRMYAWTQLTGKPQIMQTAEGMTLRQDVLLETKAVSTRPITMICGLQAEKKEDSTVTRPSLILTRAGEKTLWELAKENGSTVESICSLNDLTGEPPEDKMLLIPVEA